MGLIVQKYIQGRKEQASGGFLQIKVERKNNIPTLTFLFFDEKGKELYKEEKVVNLSKE